MPHAPILDLEPPVQPYQQTLDANQGLTQTFMSSGPQDHQLRESGGPTIFLVILTTTRPNVTILVNVEPTFFTLAMCFHFVNFVKPQKA